MSVIVIDPGHGGSVAVGGSSPNNATGPNGTMEKDLTLFLGLDLTTNLRDAGHDGDDERHRCQPGSSRPSECCQHERRSSFSLDTFHGTCCRHYDYLANAYGVVPPPAVLPEADYTGTIRFSSQGSDVLYLYSRLPRSPFSQNTLNLI